MRLFLVLGPPGVGKSSICEELVKSLPARIVHLQFGSYIERHLGSAASSRAEMRRRAETLISPAVIGAAATKLMGDLRALLGTDVCVVLESRDVAPRNYGFRGNPISGRILAEFPCEAVLGFYARSSTVSMRTEAAASGRSVMSLEDIDELAHLQRAYAVSAASACDCPLYWLNTDREMGSIVKDLRVIMGEPRNLETST